MDNLLIKKTNSSPEVNFDATAQILSMSGNLFPENSNIFFEPIMKWLENYFNQKPSGQTKINIEMIYVNSASSRALYNFFNFSHQVNEQFDIEINWIYEEENDTAEEMGEDFIEDYEDLNFNMVAK